MVDVGDIWKPGSFTKNFSWGQDKAGLVELYHVIRTGFAESLEDVPRALFRERVSRSNRPDYIPINFFLFNMTVDGEDTLLADELVFQAIAWEHNPAFDRVALFAFLFSYSGKWKGATKHQRRPALWANAYVRERLATDLHWDTGLATADDIQEFVRTDPRYEAKTSRKLSTNLSYMFRIGRLGDFAGRTVTQWWVDCVFLALDRLIADASIDRKTLAKNSGYQIILMQSDFLGLTGGLNIEKELAINHLIRLYSALGGRDRFFDKLVIQKTREDVPGTHPIPPNDPKPRGAVHPTNARIVKSIPPMCADLARHAGFEVISPGEMEDLQIEEFVRLRTEAALAVLRDRGIRPTMSLEELLSITRGE